MNPTASPRSGASDCTYLKPALLFKHRLADLHIRIMYMAQNLHSQSLKPFVCYEYC